MGSGGQSLKGFRCCVQALGCRQPGLTACAAELGGVPWAAEGCVRVERWRHQLHWHTQVGISYEDARLQSIEDWGVLKCADRLRSMPLANGRCEHP